MKTNVKYVSGLDFNWVQSVYNSNWKGIILDVNTVNYTLGYKSYNTVIYTVAIIIDKSGRPMRNRQIVKYNEAWFKKIDPISIRINKDWINVRKDEII